MKMYELVSAFNEFCAQSKMPEYTIMMLTACRL